MPPPNLLFLYTDEQAFNTLAAYGNRQIQMPHLNRLAEQSTVFDEVYVTQPVCTASRSSLLTGQYPHATGCVENNVVLRDDLPCLPEMVARGDYATGHFGKWHLGDELFAQRGFDEWVSIEDGYQVGYRPGRDRAARSDYHDHLVARGHTPDADGTFSRSRCARLPEADGKPAFLADAASRFIRAHRQHPFILYVNFLEPHMPFFGPRDDQHDVDAIPLPPNFENIPGPEQPMKTRLLWEHYRRHGQNDIPLQTPRDWQRLIANYWGLCSLIDTHVGTILETLASCGLDDNTIVVFTSDHGDMMGSHQLVAKCVMYQEAIRVPMMIRMPGESTSHRVSGPVSQIDLAPTLLDLLGQAIPDHLHGQSRRAWVTGKASAMTEDVFLEWNGPNSGMEQYFAGDTPPDWITAHGSSEAVDAALRDPVRTIIRPDGTKFNCSPRGEHELYDLAKDPHETRNLYGEQRGGAMVRGLVENIRGWQQRVGDDVALPEL